MQLLRLLRRGRLLLLSALLATASLALAASQASAYTLPPPVPIYSIYAPPGNLTLSVPDPSHPWTCPGLQITGTQFGISDKVTVTLRTVNPGTWSPNYAYNVTLLWSTDSGGNLIYLPPFPANNTSGFQYWQAVASENGHFDSYSNIVECAP